MTTGRNVGALRPVSLLHDEKAAAANGLCAAPGMTVPALVLYGERDETIPRRPACRMLAALASSARIAGYHMLTRDLGARLVLEDLAAWLADPAAPLPSGFEAEGLPALCGRYESEGGWHTRDQAAGRQRGHGLFQVYGPAQYE